METESLLNHYYAQMLNGKTNIVGIIQSLVNNPTTATSALLLHSTIIIILLTQQGIVTTRAGSKILPPLVMATPHAA